MAADPKDLITIAEAKSLLKISVSTWDTLLQSLVTGASKFIANYCDRDFCDAGQDITEYRDGYDGGIKVLVLKKFPITSITSISLRSGSFSSPTWTTLDPSSQYTFKPESGEVYFEGCLPKGHQNIKVVYRGGYAVGSFPNDLTLACQKLVGKEYLKCQAQGVVSESVGGANVSWNENLDPTVIALLSAFKNVGL